MRAGPASFGEMRDAAALDQGTLGLAALGLAPVSVAQRNEGLPCSQGPVPGQSLRTGRPGMPSLPGTRAKSGRVCADFMPPVCAHTHAHNGSEDIVHTIQ